MLQSPRRFNAFRNARVSRPPPEQLAVLCGAVAWVLPGCCLGLCGVFRLDSGGPLIGLGLAAAGELALMYSSPRAATITAMEDGSVWRVDRDVFRGILLRSDISKTLRFLREVPLLCRLSEHGLTKVRPPYH
eukprot:3393032-Pyramimonas_sp.AAC.2